MCQRTRDSTVSRLNTGIRRTRTSSERATRRSSSERYTDAPALLTTAGDPQVPIRMSGRTRYIAADVERTLLEESRGRCCICRKVRIPGTLVTGNLDPVTQKHHLIHFSSGGPNTADNLVVVCADCHTRIHRNEAAFTTEKLRQCKDHWVSMLHVVPRQLFVNVSADWPRVKRTIESTMNEEALWRQHAPPEMYRERYKSPYYRRNQSIEEEVLWDSEFQLLDPRLPIDEAESVVGFELYLESLGLRYHVICPVHIPVLCVGHYLAKNVIKPLGRYERNDWWDRFGPDGADLVLQEDVESPLPWYREIGECGLTPESVVMLLLHVVVLRYGGPVSKGISFFPEDA